GVDPFATARVRERLRPRWARAHRRRPAARSSRRRRRTPARYRWVSRPIPIEIMGKVTHGHLPEASHHGGDLVRPLTPRDGADTNQIDIGNFRYSAGDLSSIDRDGIPL